MREEKEEDKAVGEGREGRGRKVGKENRKTPCVVFLIYTV